MFYFRISLPCKKTIIKTTSWTFLVILNVQTIFLNALITLVGKCYHTQPYAGEFRKRNYKKSIWTQSTLPRKHKSRLEISVCVISNSSPKLKILNFLLFYYALEPIYSTVKLLLHLSELSKLIP